MVRLEKTLTSAQKCHPKTSSFHMRSGDILMQLPPSPPQKLRLPPTLLQPHRPSGGRGRGAGSRLSPGALQPPNPSPPGLLSPASRLVPGST